MRWLVNRRVIILIICLLLITVLVGTTMYKPSIHTANVEELMEIRGIGETLSNRVSLYLLNNPKCSINDLDNVDGIGIYRLKLIKEHYR